MNGNYNHIKRNYRTRQITLNDLLDRLLGVLIALLIVYTIWFQYAVDVINGMLLILGAACMIISVCKMLPRINISLYSKMAYIIIYILLFGMIGALSARYQDKFNEMFYSMIVYLIPPIAIVTYVDRDKNKLRKVMMAVALSTTLLAISSFTQGVSTYTNAITVGDYNPNALSNCLILGSFCLLMLLIEEKKRFTKIILVAALIVESISQIIVASRRGVIVHACLLLFFFLSVNSVKKTKNKILKWGIGIAVAVVALLVLLSFFGDFFSELAIVERFLGGNDVTASGDSLRERYQAAAMELFRERPIFGNGFGSVSGRIGAYSHSLYYETLACTGVIGFSIILVMFLRFMYLLKKSSERSLDMEQNVKLKNRLSMWFCLCVLISGIAVVFIYDMVFYIIIGLLVSIINCSRLPSKPGNR